MWICNVIEGGGWEVKFQGTPLTKLAVVWSVFSFQTWSRAQNDPHTMGNLILGGSTVKLCFLLGEKWLNIFQRVAAGGGGGGGEGGGHHLKPPPTNIVSGDIIIFCLFKAISILQSFK